MSYLCLKDLAHELRNFCEPHHVMSIIQCVKLAYVAMLGRQEKTTSDFGNLSWIDIGDVALRPDKLPLAS